MSRPRVFVTRRLPGGALDLLRQHTDLRLWDDDLPPPPGALRHQAAGAHGLLTLLTDRIDAPLLDAAPRLVAVSNMATGFDNIDVEAATRRAVLVTRTPGVLTDTTADFTFALLMAAARRVVEADRYVREGRWHTWGPEVLLGYDVHGATLGIIGLGGVGLAVARRARGFGMRVLYHSRTRKPPAERRYRLEFVPLEQLLPESDFVSLHAPLTPETRHLIGPRELAMMKPNAVLANTARGGLVDQRALYEALRHRRIAAAALDVTEEEPIPPDDPLLTLDNVVIAPHIASASFATRGRMAMLAAESLLAALRGEVPKTTVNREVTPTWRRSRVKRLSAS